MCSVAVTSFLHQSYHGVLLSADVCTLWSGNILVSGLTEQKFSTSWRWGWNRLLPYLMQRIKSCESINRQPYPRSSRWRGHWALPNASVRSQFFSQHVTFTTSPSTSIASTFKRAPEETDSGQGMIKKRLSWCSENFHVVSVVEKKSPKNWEAQKLLNVKTYRLSQSKSEQCFKTLKSKVVKNVRNLCCELFSRELAVSTVFRKWQTKTRISKKIYVKSNY